MTNHSDAESAPTRPSALGHPYRVSPRDEAADASRPAFRWLYRNLGGVRGVITALGVIWAPLAVSIAAAVFLTVPEQTLELYRYLFESVLGVLLQDVEAAQSIAGAWVANETDPKAYAWPMLDRSIYLQVALAIASAPLMYICLSSATRQAESHLAHVTRGMTGAAKALLMLAPFVIGALPAFAMVYGIWVAVSQDVDQVAQANAIVETLEEARAALGGAFQSERTDSLSRQSDAFGERVATLVAAVLGVLALLAGVYWLIKDIWVVSRRAQYAANGPGGHADEDDEHDDDETARQAGDEEARSRAFAAGRVNATSAIGAASATFLIAFLFSITTGFMNVGLEAVAFVLSPLLVIGPLLAAAAIQRFRRPVFTALRLAALIGVLGWLLVLAIFESWRAAVLAAPMALVMLGSVHATALLGGLLIGVPRGVRASAGVVREGLRAVRARRVLAKARVAEERAAWERWQRALLYLYIVGMVAALLFQPVAVPQTVGVLALFALFISMLGLVLTQLSIWSHRLGVPMITPLVLAAVVFSVVNLNDNHQARRVLSDGAKAAFAGGAGDGPYRSDLCADGRPFEDGASCRADAAFLKWIEAREDLTAYADAGRPYPVFIVAAQGGGIYAAAHTMAFLTEAQRLCPRFAQHLFAISSVSGGSVGAALYAGLAKHYADNVGADEINCSLARKRPSVSELTAPGGAFAPALQVGSDRALAERMHDLGRETVSQDFLAPLFGAAFFPDFAQRFLPYPFPEMSRAQALERAFEASWDVAHERVDGTAGDGLLARALQPDAAVAEAGDAEGAASPPRKNPMAEGFLQLWDPEEATPALIINTTETGSGRRRLIAPFRFGAFQSDVRFMPLAPDYDLPLSTAASLSARFPWLTPAGWFWDEMPTEEIAILDEELNLPSGAPERDGFDEFNEAFFDERLRDADSHERRRIRVVDGGYYENSGVASAMELIQELQKVVLSGESPPVEIHLIVLTRGGFVEQEVFSLGEAMAPIRAMLGTRAARTYTEIARAGQEIASTQEIAAANAAAREATDGPPQFSGSVSRAPVDSFFTPLPLGWTLSGFSLEQISVMAGHPDNCADDLNWDDPARSSPINMGSCVQEEILTALGAVNDDGARESPILLSGAAPFYGALRLERGFLPDPVTLRIQRGGTYAAASITERLLEAAAEAGSDATQGAATQDAETQEAETQEGAGTEDGAPASADASAVPECLGWINVRPDLHLEWEGGALAVSVESQGDATLVIQGPSDADWRCDDDTAGLNPGVGWADAPAGTYKIWVGSILQDDLAEATLLITESAEPLYPNTRPRPEAPPEVDPLALLGADAEPETAWVSAGGPISAGVVSPNCVGSLPTAPNAHLDVLEDGPLAISAHPAPNAFDQAAAYLTREEIEAAEAATPADLTLAVLTPSGDWVCDDDAFGLNPGVSFEAPEPGVYRVWVGAYSGGPDDIWATLRATRSGDPFSDDPRADALLGGATR